MITILIVDDDPRMAGALSGEVQRLGYQPFTAASAESALEVLFNENVDVLITDLRMPGWDGIELIERAKSASPRTRSILMSAYATAKDYKWAIDHGAVDVLSKPFKPEDLEQAIMKALDCSDGFQGNVHGFALTDILQMFNLARRSVTVHVGELGTVHLQNGAVVHAKCGSLQGVEALRIMLSQRSGSIRTTPFDTTERTISVPLEQLLLELSVEEDHQAAAAVEKTQSSPMSEPPLKEEEEPSPLIVDPAERSRPSLTLPPPAQEIESFDVGRRKPVFAYAALVFVLAAGLLGWFAFLRTPNEPRRETAQVEPERPPEPEKVVVQNVQNVETAPVEQTAPIVQAGAEEKRTAPVVNKRAPRRARENKVKVEPEEPAPQIVEETPKKPALGIIGEPSRPAIGIIDEADKPSVGTLED